MNIQYPPHKLTPARRIGATVMIVVALAAAMLGVAVTGHAASQTSVEIAVVDCTVAANVEQVQLRASNPTPEPQTFLFRAWGSGDHRQHVWPTADGDRVTIRAQTTRRVTIERRPNGPELAPTYRIMVAAVAPDGAPRTGTVFRPVELCDGSV